LDVADSTSVKSAAARVREQFVELSAPLFGIVNNAGTGLPSSDLKRTLEVNTYGMQRVCEAFIPLLEPHGGRIVNLTSASGPNYVSSCSRERQQLLVDPAVRWETIEAFMEECLSIRGETLEYRSRGLGSGEAYGISKALANAYTVQLAREYPQLMVNACTPGFIETDLTRPFAAMRGVSPAEMGMKSPREGTVSPLFLLFGTPHGSGHYYGMMSKADRGLVLLFVRIKGKV
jgi:NAD(P)-dependent dehydrogenase (short-subunit alcohol dehydrogenase family)